jgi:hypothetical protein
VKSEDEFSNIGPAWINRLRWDIEEKTAQPEDVEKFIRYYCHLYQSPDGIPPKVLREVCRLINQVFDEYLHRKMKKQRSGVLEAAFGLTRKQGDRNLEKRNEDIATDIARYRLSGYSVTDAVEAVSGERNEMSHSTINEAWRKHKYMAYRRMKLEYKQSGESLSDEQWKIMERDLRKLKQISEEIFGSSRK